MLVRSHGLRIDTSHILYCWRRQCGLPNYATSCTSTGCLARQADVSALLAIAVSFAGSCLAQAARPSTEVQARSIILNLGTEEAGDEFVKLGAGRCWGSLFCRCC